MARHRSLGVRRVAVAAALLVGVPVASVASTTGTAAAAPPTITNYTSTGISGPVGIAAGPDGALWFANPQQFDRADQHDRAVTKFTGTGISAPQDRGGARRCPVVHQLHGNSIGRITTSGTVTNFTGTGISGPTGIAAGPDGALWFTNREQLDRADHHHRGGHHLHRPASSPRGITAGPDGALWFTNFGDQLDRADHDRPGRSPSTPTQRSVGSRDRGGARRRPVVHQLRRHRQFDRADHHERDGDELHRHRHQRSVRDRAGARRCTVVHQPRANSIGRITTSGTVTNYTGTGVNAPSGIAVGPDGALWFTNSGTTRSGGSRPGIRRSWCCRVRRRWSKATLGPSTWWCR